MKFSKIFNGITHVILAFSFAIFLFQIELTLAKQTASDSKSIAISRKQFFGTCVPSFDKIYQQLTSPEQFSTLDSKSHDFECDDL